MSESDLGPVTTSRGVELWAAEKAARRFFLDDRSKIQIAAEMGISRFRVARLLDLARSAGIVTFRIVSVGDINGELGLALQDRFGLREAVVVSTPRSTDNGTLRQQLGGAAAGLLSTAVTADDVVGFGWARSVLSTVANLTRMAACPVVQLTGALSRPDVESDSIKLVRNVARITGGTASYFYAPMITGTPATRRAINAQADVAAARTMYDSVTTAVVGVGCWDPHASTLREALSPAERAAASREGVYADLSGVLLNKRGTPARSSLTNRIVGITAAQLLAVPNVVAIAYGDEKVGATRVAIEAGYINTLVTHASFAEALLR